MPPIPTAAVEPGATLDRSWDEMLAKQQANMTAWGLGTTDRWDADLDLQLIRFSSRNGPVITADLQIIGSYNLADGSWLWAWDNPSIDHPLAHAARMARDFGERYGLSAYTTPMINCSEEDAWGFTALALHLWGGAGSYRGPSGSTYVYMTFGPVTVSRSH